MELTWPGAVLWGPSALQLWIPHAPLPGTGVVVAASERSRTAATNLKLIRTRAADIQGEDWHGVRVQSSLWAVIDSLRILDQRQADGLFAWLMTRQQIPGGFAAEVGSLAGQRGFNRLVAYARYQDSGAAAESEMLLHNALRRMEITGWQPNARVRLADGTTLKVDLLFVEAKLVVEIDGFSFHSGREAFENDRERDRQLTRAGYKVVRFTWRDLTERLDHVISEIAFHLD
jgi:very-short-patch-repair endonuclease